MNKKALVIGSGFAGLTSASILAKNGFDVTLLEKNEQSGGRCSVFSEEGFTFDMGPSWYWMPDVFEHFFNIFNYKTADLLDLIQLSPSYQVIFEDEIVKIPANFSELKLLFEKYEVGSAEKLELFVSDAKYKYEVGMNDLVYKPSLSMFEFLDIRILKGIFQTNLFTSFSSHIKKYFSHPKILQILEFPVLFLGAKPKDTPALYSLMNYADIILGTWYPMNGMVTVSKAFERIALENGVKIKLNQAVKKINTNSKKVISVETETEIYKDFDYVISAADYHHTEKLLNDSSEKNYSEEYWDTRKLAPSCFLYYLGIDKIIENAEHHNLFFDSDFSVHTNEIYDSKTLPTDPLFYVCVPSKTDETVAPKGKENIFILIPIATGITETDENREYYLNLALKRMETKFKTNIKEHIIYQKSFATRDFIYRYNSYKGNAYGLANTLSQTAILKPRIKNKKIENLYYCGQMSVPGPGVPPSIISGEIVANYIVNLENINKTKILEKA